MSPAAHHLPYRATCRATFVGTCPIPGSISENHTLSCARDLIRDCSDYFNWTVSVEDNELRMVLRTDSTTTAASSDGSTASSAGSDTDSDKETSGHHPSHIDCPDCKQSGLHYRNVPLSRVLFCYIDAQFPNVISWVLTKNYNSSSSSPDNKEHQVLSHAGLDNATTAKNNVLISGCDEDEPPNGSRGLAGLFFQRAETEALVWECVNEKDTAALQEVYKNIRSRKKHSKIEAIAKAKKQIKSIQLQQQQQQQHQLLQLQSAACESKANVSDGVKCENGGAKSAHHHHIQNHQQHNHHRQQQQNNETTSLKNGVNGVGSNFSVNDRLVHGDGSVVSASVIGGGSSGRQQLLPEPHHQHHRGTNKGPPNREILVQHHQDNRVSSNKSHCRQRHPALLLQPTKTSSPSPGSKSQAMSMKAQVGLPMALTAPVSIPAVAHNPGAYWVTAAYQSESEFDTTRIGRYFNTYASNGAAPGNRAYQGSQRRYMSRSRSVDAAATVAPLNRLRISPTVHSKNSINNKLLSKQQQSIQIQHQLQQQTNMTSFAVSGNANNRALIVTRSESLNSDASSLSGDNDSDMIRNQLINSLSVVDSPPKSALKKCGGGSGGASSTASSSPPLSASLGHHSQQASQFLGGKKNVTFSAFATIQLMDK